MTETVIRDSYHHGELAEAALTAALAQIEREGADALSMRGLAAALGVAHRALYRHYADRDALLGACAAAGYEALARAVADASTLPSYAEAYLRFALARPLLYETMIRSHARAPGESLAKAIARVIERARQAIGDDRRVQRVWTILHGGLSLHAAGAMRARDDDALVGFLIALAEGD